jgi:hypothetical protein
MSEQKREADGKFAAGAVTPKVPTPVAANVKSAIHPVEGRGARNEFSYDPVYLSYRKFVMAKQVAAIVEAHPDLFPAGGVWYFNDQTAGVERRVYSHASLSAPRFLDLDETYASTYKVYDRTVDGDVVLAESTSTEKIDY